MLENSIDLTAVLLAGGRGSRLRPLTDTKPKPLMEVQGRTLLERNLEKIYLDVSRIVIVISYLGEQIQDLIGDNYKGTPVFYAWQKYPKGGTLDAFRTGVYCTDLEKDLKTNYLVSNSDDLHGPEIYKLFFQNIISNPAQALVSAKNLEDEEELKKYGVFRVDSNDSLQEVVEKPQEYVSNLINTGIYYFPAKVTNLINPERDPALETEEYLTDHLLNPYNQKDSIKVVPTKDLWFPVSTPENLDLAQGLNLDD